MLPVPVLMPPAGIASVVPATAVTEAFAASDRELIVRALTSRRETEAADEFTVTPPVKSLIALLSVTAAPPESNTLEPVTDTTPLVACVIAPEEVSARSPLITTADSTAAPVWVIVVVPEARLPIRPNAVAWVASVIPVAAFALTLLATSVADPLMEPAPSVTLPEPFGLIALENDRLLVLLAPPSVLKVMDWLAAPPVIRLRSTAPERVVAPVPDVVTTAMPPKAVCVARSTTTVLLPPDVPAVMPPIPPEGTKVVAPVKPVATGVSVKVFAPES